MRVDVDLNGVIHSSHLMMHTSTESQKAASCPLVLLRKNKNLLTRNIHFVFGLVSHKQERQFIESSYRLPKQYFPKTNHTSTSAVRFTIQISLCQLHPKTLPKLTAALCLLDKLEK